MKRKQKRSRVLEIIVLMSLILGIILLLSLAIFKFIDSRPLPKGEKITIIGEIYV